MPINATMQVNQAGISKSLFSQSSGRRVAGLLLAVLFCAVSGRSAPPPDSLGTERIGQAASAALQAGRYQDAIRSFEELLPIYRAKSNRAGEAASLTGLIFAYRSLGNQAEVVRCGEEVLPIFRELGDRRMEASTLVNLGTARWALKDYDKGLRELDAALSIFREVKDDAGAAYTLYTLGYVYVSRNETNSAITSWEQALPIRDKAVNTDWSSVYDELALIYQSLGQPQQAAERWQSASAIHQLRGQLDKAATSLGNAGFIYYSMGQYQNAVDCFTKILPMRRTLKDRRGEGQTVEMLGSFSLALDRPADAAGYYQQAVEIFQEVKDLPAEAQSLAVLGRCYHLLKRSGEALPLYEQAITIFHQLGDRKGEASALCGAGFGHNELNQFEKAIQCYSDAVKLASMVGDQGTEGTAHNGLGVAYLSLSRDDEALVQFAQGLKLVQAVKDHKQEREALTGLVTLSLRMKRYTDVLRYDTRSLDIARSINDRASQAEALRGMGVAYQALGQHEQAIASFKDAVLLYHQLGNQNPEDLSVYSLMLSQLGLGLMHSSRQEHDKAVAYLEEALFNVQTTTNRLAEAQITDALGWSYFMVGRTNEAISCSEQVLPLLRQLHLQVHEAQVLSRLGMFYSLQGRDFDAIKPYQEALKLYRDLGDKQDEVVVLASLGVVHTNLQDSSGAIFYYDQALALQFALGDRKGQVQTIRGLQQAWTCLGENDLAVQLFEDACRISRQLRDEHQDSLHVPGFAVSVESLLTPETPFQPDEQELATARERRDPTAQLRIRNALAESCREKGFLDRAAVHASEAIELAKASKDREAEVTALNSLGLTFIYQARFTDGISCHERALAISRANGNRAGEAESLMGYGVALLSLGQMTNALVYLDEALTISREVANPLVEARCLNDLGLCLLMSGDVPKAADYFYRGGSIAIAANDCDLQCALILNLGHACQSLEKYESAIMCYEQAYMLAKDIGQSRRACAALIGLSRSHAALGENETAFRYCEAALEISRKTKQPLIEAAALSNLMKLWAKRGKTGLAILYGKEAINIAQDIRGDIQPLQEDFRRSFVKSVEADYRELADLLITQGRVPEAQQVLGLLKQQEYFEFVRRDAAQADAVAGRAELTPAEATGEKRYHEIGDQITALGVQRSGLLAKTNRSAEENKQLATLEKDLEISNRAFQMFLDELAAEFEKVPREENRIDNLREAQALMADLRELGNGTVALYTIVGEKEYRVILVTPDVEKVGEYPIGASELGRKVTEFREQLENPRLDPLPAAKELYQILIGPIAKDLEGAQARTLMWSLDGVLRYIPIAALHDGQGYMVQRYRNVVFTLASQARLKDVPGERWRGLGLGVSKEHEGFSALKGVPDELHGIIRDERDKTSRGVVAGTVELDEDFTEESFRSSLRDGYGLVHVASHFRFRPGNEMDSFLLLGDGQHLTLDRIRSLPNVFGGVELLTLSACDTAVGGLMAGGKEVEGFAVLAQRQGAKAVMATLWPVADQSTQLLMRRFYELRESTPHLSKAESLQRAQLELLAAGRQATKIEGGQAQVVGYKPVVDRDYSHPYYWAPFILIGNWR
jgi:tetratricopeptide (TPR) repeat protein